MVDPPRAAPQAVAPRALSASPGTPVGSRIGRDEIPVSAPSPAVREPPPARVLAPLGPADVEKAWSLLKEALPVSLSTMIDEVALAVEIRDGRLVVAVKVDTWRGKVRDAIGKLELAAVLPGILRIEVEVSAAGQTGRERRTEADEVRRVAARVAAENSAILRKLLKVFDAEIDSVEPLAEAVVEPVVGADPETPESAG